MKCEKVKQLLFADYVDGEISPDEKGEVDSHLLSCEGCQKVFESVMNENMFSINNHAVPLFDKEAVWSRLVHQIETAQVRGPAERIAISTPMFGSLAVAAAVLLAVFLFQPRPASYTVPLNPAGNPVIAVAYLDQTFNANTSDEPEGYGTAIEAFLI